MLQEWLRLACHSDAHPELVRRHLVTFRAMSVRLLDYVVNIADSNGNTALHYSVSHANFPVVRQLLGSGEPAGGAVGRWCPQVRWGRHLPYSLLKKLPSLSSGKARPPVWCSMSFPARMMGGRCPPHLPGRSRPYPQPPCTGKGSHDLTENMWTYVPPTGPRVMKGAPPTP